MVLNLERTSARGDSVLAAVILAHTEVCFASWWQEGKSHTQYFDWMNDGERLGF